jgi:hypothetical protein
VDDAAEMLAKVASRAEATALRDDIDRQVTDFEKSLCEVDALALQPLMWRRSGGGDEAAGERTRAHGGSVGHVIDRQWLVQMVLGPGDRVGEEAGALERGHGRIDELSLTPVALGWDDQLSGQLRGDLGTMVKADDMEAEVDAGSTPG